MFQKKEIAGEPLEDRLLVERGETPEKIGSIVIPDTAKRKSLWGIVRAVGPGTRIYTAHGDWTGEVRPMDLAVGDKVRFSQYAGVDVELDDTAALSDNKMVVLRYGEIIMVERGAKTTSDLMGEARQ